MILSFQIDTTEIYQVQVCRMAWMFSLYGRDDNNPINISNIIAFVLQRKHNISILLNYPLLFIIVGSNEA